jgi:glycosyltransferase involved in cell wall biosynthesis
VPTVSVCIPTYNSASYVAQTLDSILAQTYRDFEIIVSDNCSSDETRSILREYESAHGIRLHFNERNIGPGANFNKLIDLARGELVAIYHADDLYEPSIVSTCVNVFMEDDEIALVGTMATAINSTGEKLFDYSLPHFLVSGGIRRYGFDEAMRGVISTLGNEIFFITPSIMVRKSLYNQLGRFDESSYKCSGDYEMWLRIARRRPVAIIDKPLMNYRLHDKQGSELEVRKNVELPDLLLVFDEYAGYLTNTNTLAECRRFVDRAVIKTALKQNCINQFEKSSTTLGRLGGPAYRLAGRVIAWANRLGLNLHIRP